MDRELSQCTAGDLASSPVETLSAETTVTDAVEWLSENGYDFAPVVETDQPIGYVAIEDLAAVSDTDGTTPIETYTDPITLDEIISSAASFEACIQALYDNPVYFLGGRNQVTGILTRADLNRSPAYIHLYDRLSVLEEQMREVVLAHAPEWKTDPDVALTDDEQSGIESRYRKATRANIELAEIHYAQFSTLTKIIYSINACWQACGFETANAARRALTDVTDLRNAVAHSNLIIENTDAGLFEGRTVGELVDAYDAIDACLTALAEEDSTG